MVGFEVHSDFKYYKGGIYHYASVGWNRDLKVGKFNPLEVRISLKKIFISIFYDMFYLGNKPRRSHCWLRS